MSYVVEMHTTIELISDSIWISLVNKRCRIWEWKERNLMICRVKKFTNIPQYQKNKISALLLKSFPVSIIEVWEQEKSLRGQIWKIRLRRKYIASFIDLWLIAWNPLFSNRAVFLRFPPSGVPIMIHFAVDSICLFKLVEEKYIHTYTCISYTFPKYIDAITLRAGASNSVYILCALWWPWSSNVQILVFQKHFVYCFHLQQLFRDINWNDVFAWRRTRKTLIKWLFWTCLP